MKQQLVAVTIGVGAEHEFLAKQAAERMERFTDLEVRILGEVEYAASGCRHPCHLKFRLFDLVDAENILYFDADAFCLRPWEPRPLCNRPEWLGVRGFWFDPWVERLGRAYGFGHEIFSGGLFLCNRTHHHRALQLAEILQGDDDMFQGSWNPDEVALCTALKILGIEIEFLDRRHNWLRYGRGNFATRAGAIIAHACDEALRRSFLAGKVPCSDTPAATRAELLPQDVTDKVFIYDRVGYDLRPMEFRRDGTIGRGGGDAERFYYVNAQDGVRRLVIGGVDDQTCTLLERAEGVWQGRWLHHERMPVRLEKHRGQTLIDLIRSRRPGFRANPLRGAELGVYSGETSALLLRGIENLHLYMVDPWREAASDSEYRSTGDCCALLAQSRYDQLMFEAAAATEFAADRRTIIPCRQEQAADFAPDGLDFVFVDGDHSYSGTLSAIERWRPKLARSGLISGHDYAHPYFPGVRQAVDEFAAHHHLRVRAGPDRVWWYEEDPSHI